MRSFQFAAVSAGLVLAADLFLAAGHAFAAAPVEGDWITDDGVAKVRIAPCAGKPDRLCGRIVAAVNPADANRTDTKNPDPKLRSRPLAGVQMMWDYAAAGGGRWTGGRLYDPNSGKTYDGKLSLNPNGTLKVEGCVAVICLAKTWRKA